MKKFIKRSGLPDLDSKKMGNKVPLVSDRSRRVKQCSKKENCESGFTYR